MALTPREHGETRRAPATPAAKKEGGRLLQRLRNSVSTTAAVALAGLLGLKAAHAADTNVVVLEQSSDNAVTAINADDGSIIQEFTISGGSSAVAGGVVVSGNTNCIYVASKNGTSDTVSEYCDTTSSVRTDYVTTSSDTYDLTEDESTGELIGVTADTVYVVDESSMTVTGESSSVSGGDFETVKVLTSGTVLVADHGNDQLHEFTISSGVPTLTNSFTMTSGMGISTLDIDPTSGYAIVGGRDNKSISWVDPLDGSIDNTLSDPMGTISYGGNFALKVLVTGELIISDHGVMTEGDTNTQVYENSGSGFQDSLVTDFAIGTMVEIEEVNGIIQLSIVQSSGEQWGTINETTWASTSTAVSGFSGSPEGIAVGTISDGSSGTDADGDGYNSTATGGDDCDDTNAAVSPSEPETPYNGTDDDCDPATLDDDLDEDGHNSTATGGDDCDDTNAAVSPSEPETPYDGTDNDCNSSTPDDDLDEDGSVEAYDCDDADPDVNPDQTEVCDDGKDNDCVDGDESCPPEDDDNDGVPNESDLCPDTPIDEVANMDGCSSSQLTTPHDEDEDGYEDENYGGDDCDDADPDVNPSVLDDYDAALIDNDCNGTANDYGTDAISITDAQGNFSLSISGNTITIIRSGGSMIEWMRTDPTWTINQELYMDAGGYDLGGEGTHVRVEYDDQNDAIMIILLDPSVNIHNRTTDEVYGRLTTTGATATVKTDSGDIYMDTDGDGQEELVHEGSPDTGDDDTAPDDDDTGVNPPTGPDCGGCNLEGQTNPGAVQSIVALAIAALLRRRRKEQPAKKAA